MILLRSENRRRKEQSTLERIHTAAQTEFMEKGFHAASLRNIVKTAGVTTGAFYGYYDSKEALFEALVGDAAEYVLNLFCGTVDDFEEMAGEEQTRQMLGMFSGLCETIIHDMPREEAKEYLMQLQRFYLAGWEELLGVRFGMESGESE